MYMKTNMYMKTAKVVLAPVVHLYPFIALYRLAPPALKVAPAGISKEELLLEAYPSPMAEFPDGEGPSCFNILAGTLVDLDPSIKVLLPASSSPSDPSDTG